MVKNRKKALDAPRIIFGEGVEKIQKKAHDASLKKRSDAEEKLDQKAQIAVQENAEIAELRTGKKFYRKKCG